jgi:hypothetical protein
MRWSSFAAVDRDHALAGRGDPSAKRMPLSGLFPDENPRDELVGDVGFSSAW